MSRVMSTPSAPETRRTHPGACGEAGAVHRRKSVNAPPSATETTRTGVPAGTDATDGSNVRAVGVHAMSVFTKRGTPAAAT